MSGTPEETLRRSEVKHEQPENAAADNRGVADKVQDTDQLAIGMYYPTAGSLHTSGIVTYIRETVRALSGAHSPYLYTESEAATRSVQRAGAEVVQIDRNGIGERTERLLEYFSRTGLSTAEVLRKRLPTLVAARQDGTLRHLTDNLDVVVTHNYLDDVLLSNVVDVPVVTVFHGASQVGAGTKLWNRFSNGDGVVANSRHTAERLEHHFDREVDGVVYPGIDLETFRPDVEPAFDRDETVVMFAGRFTKEKGALDLVDAVTQLPADHHLCLVGRGDGERIESHAAERGVRDSITVLGSVPHEAVPRYYRAADVVCSPTHYDSFCMVNVEAMACGTPVVTTDIDGVTEYATDRETALLVAPGDVDELADAIVEVSTSPDLRDYLRDRGLAAAERYSWERSAERLADVCRRVS